MGRQAKKINVFKNRELIYTAKDVHDARTVCGLSVMSIYRYLSLGTVTPTGFAFKYVNEGDDVKHGENTVKRIENLTDDINRTKFWIPKAKEERKQLLIKFLYTRLKKHWREVSYDREKDEREFLRELLKTL